MQGRQGKASPKCSGFRGRSHSLAKFQEEVCRRGEQSSLGVLPLHNTFLPSSSGKTE